MTTPNLIRDQARRLRIDENLTGLIYDGLMDVFCQDEAQAEAALTSMDRDEALDHLEALT